MEKGDGGGPTPLSLPLSLSLSLFLSLSLSPPFSICNILKIQQIILILYIVTVVDILEHGKNKKMK